MRKFFSSSLLFRVLLALNIIVSLIAFISFLDFATKGDAVSYMALAKSIWEGKYSFWTDIFPVYLPDTLRPPGYPLFLSLFVWLPSSYRVIQWVQLFIYLSSIWMCLGIISKFDKSKIAGNIFLLLLLPAIQLPYYATQLLPECTVGAALVAFLLLCLKEKKNKTTFLLIGLLWLYVFECRPVFLFFPFLFIAWECLKKRSSFEWKKWSLALIVFIAGTMPYGYWNYKHHGVFRITPLEGGGGIIMAGYWQYKLPDVAINVATGFIFDKEIISNDNRNEITKDSLRFLSDYNEILDKSDRYLSETDRLYNDTMLTFSYRPLWPTLSGRYTIEREHLFLEKAKQYISNDPWYWLSTRPFNILRLFVTNIIYENLASK